jgi:hypothetical protein
MERLSERELPFAADSAVTAAQGALDAPGNTQTADQVKPTVEKLGGIGPGQPFFDPTAFAAPTGVRLAARVVTCCVDPAL